MEAKITLKPIIFSILSLFLTKISSAQSKLLREVGEDISTQMKPITQDNALVGYLAFTRLEKATADSFNYRVTIMDENLHDIGAVNFRQGLLDLQAVSFEQSTLCLGYIQSAVSGVETVKTQRQIRKAQDAADDSHILLQFIDLNGKIINSWYKDVHLTTSVYLGKTAFSSPKLIGYLKYGMQITNIPNGGFAFFYGDESKQQLLRFDAGGNLGHQLEIPNMANHFLLRASASDVYLLTKRNGGTPEGGFKLYDYSAKDLSENNSFDLRDGYDNWLKVLSFDNDPATGDAFIAGCIINPHRERDFLTPTDYSYAPYIGLFTLDLGNPHKDMHANCSYWNNDSIPGIAADGMFNDKEFYVKYTTAFKDYSGNTIFAGTALVGKGFVGSAKYKLTDGVFVRQEASGTIALDGDIPCDESKSFGPAGILPQLDKKDYYKVVNQVTHTNYMIIDDEQNIYIYNVNAKKLVRTIPHKDGNVKINVFPAKEGHMMVAEYNRKEHTTRLSIEAL